MRANLRRDRGIERRRDEAAQESDGNGAVAATCPLCGLAADDDSLVYVHLQTGHRKSAMARALLGDGDEDLDR